MIGYLFLFTNVLVGVSKGYCGKKSSEHINGITDGLLLQSIRVLLCVVIGGILFFISGEGLEVDKTILIISALNGLANAAFLLSWLFAVRGGAYLFVDVCLTAGGILIPCFSGALFFGGTIKPTQYIGIVIMMAAVFVMCGYNNSITKKKLSITDILLLLCVALSNGLMGFCQKFFTYYTDEANVVCNKSYFGLLTFIFAAIIFIIAIPIVCKKTKINIKQSFNKFPFKRLWVYIIFIAIFLYLDTYLGTLTNEYITNTVLIYPLKFGSNLILSAIMAAVMFKEKINMRSIFGMILITISIVLINVI
ncbi:MAG: EamA family transporter [Clostridia bacterium]|nr:EamA family transporter [Clostridia bacterium]